MVQRPTFKPFKATAARCEILDVYPTLGTASIRCHRCKVLGVECSFESSDLIHFTPKPTNLHTPPEASTSSAATTPHSPATVESSPAANGGGYGYDGGLNTLAAAASSRSNAEPSGAEPVSGSSNPMERAMRPADLLPTPTTPIWGSVPRADWTATPMLAIQDLTRCPRADTWLQLPAVDRLSDVLSAHEIASLLEIFEDRYSPWLCAQPGPPESSNVLLDIVRCTIASRHLSPGSRSTIAPRLHKLTEDAFLREVFNPQPSLESIKALLILSVWTPICGTGAEARDGRLLIASAVSMAMNLRLKDESKHLAALRADKSALSPTKQAELKESSRKWRMWMYLSTCESMLCIGTGRTPVSEISQLDQDLLNLSSLPRFDLSAVRDIRLGLTARMFDVAQNALKLRLKSVADLTDFFDQINASLGGMENLGRFLTPLPVITPHDVVYSQMLTLQYRACRLLMLHHGIRETRTAYERETPEVPWMTASSGGHSITHWGRMALSNAEGILSSFLGPSDLTLLSSAPDNLYVYVAFAATWIFVSNFHLVQLGKSKVGGASERLQSMTIERLNQIAHAPDHAAARCGHVLNALMGAWEQRNPLENTVSRWRMLDIPYTRAPGRPDPSLPVGEEGYVSDPSYGDFLGGIAVNPDLFMDDAFWTSCEILEPVSSAPGGPVTIRCHRCKTIGAECSFETSDLFHFVPKTTSGTSPATSGERSGPASVTAPDAGLNALAAVASSRENAAEVPMTQIRGQHRLSPEDLLPTTATPIWGSVSRDDWTATPMLAIQELVRCLATSTLQIPAVASSLSDILSPPEITLLLEMFKLTEDIIPREIFDPQPSLESIRALLILSLWTPVCGTGAEARDGRLLIASAVSMAKNLHLQNESKRTLSLRAEQDGLSADKQAELNESTERWRLWMSLSVSESMLCLGTGRTPVSHFSQLDQEMVDLSALQDFTPSAVRDLRLALSAKTLDITQIALTGFRLKNVEHLESFFDEINAAVQSMDGLSRLLTPLPVLTEYDTFYSHMLLLQFHASRLLILHHALRETRTAYERDQPQMPWLGVRVKGQSLSMLWAYQALISAETALTTFLASSDLALMGTLPDNYYVLVGFAATWIFVSNFSLLQLGKSPVGGASERLQSMTIERLTQIALSSDHAAARCRHVLSSLMSAWQRRNSKGNLPVSMCMLDVPFARFPVRNPDPAETVVGYPTPLSYEDPVSGAAANSELFMDDAFWASFIENLSSDAFIAQNSAVL
ncbi:hypothetical protein DFH06DRAFT_1319973 [Mycena polygramma]|nr:hypothetical protein DFH06DRAFT_1319973 [Mycena polygramma]